MSRLSQLQGKPQKFKIGGIELELHPLTLAELNLFPTDESASLDSAKKMITAVLKKSVSDATDEEISKISLEHMEEIMNAITKLHKLSGDKMAGFKDAIRNKQAAAIKR